MAGRGGGEGFEFCLTPGEFKVPLCISGKVPFSYLNAHKGAGRRGLGWREKLSTHLIKVVPEAENMNKHLRESLA